MSSMDVVAKKEKEMLESQISKQKKVLQNLNDQKEYFKYQRTSPGNPNQRKAERQAAHKLKVAKDTKDRLKNQMEKEKLQCDTMEQNRGFIEKQFKLK